MEIINELNSLQESVDSITKNTSALREVTYKYASLGGDLYLNETIFVDYVGWDSPETFVLYMQELGSTDQLFFEKIKSQTAEKLDTDIGVLQKYLLECDYNEKTQIELQITALEFTKNAIDFDLELAGYKHGLSQEEITAKISKQEELDELLFGEHVSKNADFILESYAYSQDLLDTNGHKLSPEHRGILEQSQSDLLLQVATLRRVSVDEIEIPKYQKSEKDSEFKKLSKIKIPREDYIRIFDIFFEISNVPQRSKVGNYSSFSDGDTDYGVPNSPSYDKKTLEEILRLSPHETSHYINLQSTVERGDGKQAGDMLKDEGVSMLTEALVSGKNIESMSYMTFGAQSVIMNRLYAGDKYLEFQDAYLELLDVSGISTKGDVIQKTLRKKRGFHKNIAGGSNKDAAYALGMKGVLEYVRNGEGEIQNLFGGKISLEQMKSGDYKPEGFGNQYINHILLSELIFFYLKNKGLDGLKCNGIHKEFVSYLQNKYKYFVDSFELFNEAEKFCFANKRKVVQILNIIERAKNESEDSKTNKNETSQTQ